MALIGARPRSCVARARRAGVRLVLLGVLALGAGAAAGSATPAAPSCVPATLGVSAQLPGTSLTVSPEPGSLTRRAPRR